MFRRFPEKTETTKHTKKHETRNRTKNKNELKNRTSSHFFILVLIVILAAISHYSIYYGGLIRGYETSGITAYRNIGLLAILALLPVVLKRFPGYQGNWTLYTTA